MKFAIREQALNAMWRAQCAAMRYSYRGTGYANPHATTQIGNGTATTSYSYDNNRNLTSARAPVRRAAMIARFDFITCSSDETFAPPVAAIAAPRARWLWH